MFFLFYLAVLCTFLKKCLYEQFYNKSYSIWIKKNAEFDADSEPDKKISTKSDGNWRFDFHYYGQMLGL
jgi:hypothetical protein